MGYISKAIITIGNRDLDDIILEWSSNLDKAGKTVNTMNKGGEAKGFKSGNAARSGSCKVEPFDDPTLPDWDRIIETNTELSVKIQPWDDNGPIGRPILHPRVRFMKSAAGYTNGDGTLNLDWIAIGRRRG